MAVWHDEGVRWRSAQIPILSALTVFLLGIGVVHAASVSRPDGDPGSAGGRSAALAGRPVYATIDPTPTGSPLPAGFLGLSFEYNALEAYSGAPAAPNPVFVQLLRNLDRAGGHLIIRIGGNSTDTTWWPVPGMKRPPGVSYALTPDWLAGARGLAAALGAKLMLGVNLAAASPRLISAEATALLEGVSAGNVAALEIGNEPDVYRLFPWYRLQSGPVFARRADYGLSAFVGEIRDAVGLLPPAPLAGPATAKLPWLTAIPSLIAAEPGLQLITVHRYALQGCVEDRKSPSYPSVANLLSARASTGLAQALMPYVTLAHDRGRQFRVDELNSAALAGCPTRPGVSSTFASALWMLDTLFNLASVGVDGVNVHSLPGAAYELFTFRHDAGGWRAVVRPDYYGMLMFAQAFPPGARLLPVRATASPVKVWATRAADGRIRVVLINKGSQSERVGLQLPPSSRQAQLEWLRAPGPSATSGVTLGGRSFGAETTSGLLPAPATDQPVSQLLGRYSVQVPPYSAALLTR